MSYSEDNLTQQTLSDYLSDELGWESVFAYNNEVLVRKVRWVASQNMRWC